MSVAEGFTLIEMLVVLAVLGTLVGLVVSRGPPHSASLDLRGAATQVAQALRVARTRAIASNGPVAFTAVPAARTYAVTGTPLRTLPPGMDLAIIATADLASARAGAIVFQPDGSSSGGRVELSAAGRRMDVGVDWLTGRVVVANGS